MPRRLTNLLLLGLVLGLAVSGLLGWVLPEPAALPLYSLHRALGVGLVLLLLPKLRISRASLRRRLGRGSAGSRGRGWDRSVLIGLTGGTLLLATIGLGLAWTFQVNSFDALWGYSPLNLHVFGGLAVVPLMLWHLGRRWEGWPALPVLASRRNALRLVGLGAATLVGWRAIERGAEALAEAGERRPSGSKHAGSFSGNAYPVTIWAFDQVPLLEAETWRLEVVGRVARPGAASLADLAALPEREQRAVLDCTSGWWSEQVWQGVGVGEALAAFGPDPEASWAAVVSVTGHRWVFPLAELQEALLATRVGGEVLTPGHGYPVRLVAPNRRGFQWVKWVGRIEVG